MSPVRPTHFVAALVGVLAGSCASSEDPSGTDDSDDPGDVFSEDVVRTYDLEIADADWDWLNENAVMEEYVPAAVVVDGERFEPVGVRFKGGEATLFSCFDASGARLCPKLSIKISFDEYTEDAEFHGLRKLVFNSMVHDYTGLRERLGYWLFREMDVPASRATHARLRVNGQSQGLFSLVEPVDGRFTRRVFADGGEGNLYKETWPVFDGVDPDVYRSALVTNEDEGDVSGIESFATALSGATEDTFLSTIDGWMDGPNLWRLLAVDRAINDWDGITAFYCVGDDCFNHNYYWYEEVTHDRFWLVPWDMDLTFFLSNPWTECCGVPGWREPVDSCEPIVVSDPYGLMAPTCDPFIDRLGRVGFEQYAGAAAELLDGPFAPGVAEAKIDEWAAQIQPFVEEDSFGPSMDSWTYEVMVLRDEIEDLRDRLHSEIGE